jgi:plasmid stability protein
MTTRNITLSLPDELVRKAKVFAAARDTSISALVGDLLGQLVGENIDYDQAWSAEEAVMASGPLRVGAITWTRDDLHAR